MFVIKIYDSIWPNFILVLSRFLKKQREVYLLMFNNVYDNITDFQVFEYTKNTKI